MIVVRIYWDNQAICGLSVCGHSDYSPRGSDIVCSAVSALAQTAVLALDAVVGVKPRFVRQEGLLLCKLPPDLSEEARKEAGIVLRTVVTGIENIARHYPHHVTVTNKEV
ncbi:MAG: ribosomal-processing cysteine protease Prp [Bacillota bacterium]|jgi:uncharacterized protein YsxB (DUF464 family)